MTVVLVACVGKKLPNPAPAHDLYQSAWFKKARHYAELVGEQWYILSAKYGLLEPDRVIEPYNVTLNEMRKSDRVSWAVGVWHRLLLLVPASEPIVMLAGKYYREPLVEYLGSKGYTVNIPMAGLGIGQQMAWLG